MSARHVGRTAPCTTADARSRLRQATAYLTVAELVDGDQALPAWSDAAAGNAVLAGIAAADAICCAAAGEHARGQDHASAERLLRRAVPDGDQVAGWLRRLLEVKDAAHYGLQPLSPQRARGAIRQARHLVERAEREVAAAG